jgi:hypothetical protein
MDERRTDDIPTPEKLEEEHEELAEKHPTLFGGTSGVEANEREDEPAPTPPEHDEG